jgi:hypothetical protein
VWAKDLSFVGIRVCSSLPSRQTPRSHHKDNDNAVNTLVMPNPDQFSHHHRTHARSATRLVAARRAVVAEPAAAALDRLGLGDGDDVDGDGVELSERILVTEF